MGMLALELSLGLDPSRCCAPKWRGGVPPWLGRLLLRTLYLGAQVFVAQALLSGEGDTLLALQGLIGAVGMVAFTYFLPYLFHAVLSPRPLSRRRRAWAALNVLIGVAVMCAGLVAAVADLLGSRGGFFAGQCRLAWAFAPDDACNATGPAPRR